MNPEVTEGNVGEDGIYFRAAESTYAMPPELKCITKTRTSSNMSWIVNPKDINLSRNNWQSDPSRIIYHGGRYHMWMIDLDRAACAEGQYWADNDFFSTPEGREFRPRASRVLYLSSEDTHHWTAHGHLPLGPEGSCYDLLLEQPNVVFHEGRFYLFTEAWSTNIEKYGHRMAGITCLVADSPAGPWANPPGVDVLVRPEMDGESWESDRVLNPRHMYHKGKWFMYYKGIREGMPTENGLAISDTITGPYRKYEGNPVLKGHGHFCWRYKHGMLMIPNYGDMESENGERWIHWSEDGIHFVPIEKSNNVFPFGSLYVPYDPLSGEPQTEESTTTFWGFESVKPPDRDWDVERIEWTIGDR